MTTAFAHDVYQVLDDVLSGNHLGPGARGKLAYAIDTLRTLLPGSNELRIAEHISVECHKLTWAQNSADRTEMQRATDALRQLAGEWLSARVGI